MRQKTAVDGQYQQGQCRTLRDDTHKAATDKTSRPTTSKTAMSEAHNGQDL